MLGLCVLWNSTNFPHVRFFFSIFNLANATSDKQTVGIKMNETLKIKERKPIWIALSEFYLDIELQESDLRDIAFKIMKVQYI